VLACCRLGVGLGVGLGMGLGVVGVGLEVTGEVSTGGAPVGAAGVGSSTLRTVASPAGSAAGAVGRASWAPWSGRAAPGSYQSSSPGGTTPMFGIASGPPLDHSVGTTGNARATGAAPSCVATAAGV
jgi:hypothetical protein